MFAVIAKCSAALVLVPMLFGCGPEQGEEPADASWVVGRYLACSSEELFTECTGGQLSEVEFFEDGDVITTEIACGVRKVPDVGDQARWHPGSEGTVEVVPLAGASGLRFGVGSASSVTVRRTDDCLLLDVESVRDRDEPFEDLIDDSFLHRGSFIYEVTACTSTKPLYAGNQGPSCPTSLAE